MFTYKVQSPDSLISFVTISGQYITLWQNTSKGSELGVFFEKNQDLLECVKFSEDLRHIIFHMDKEYSEHHIHLILTKKLDHLSFAEFVSRLESASHLEARKMSFEYFVSSLDAQRISLGDVEFPHYVQESIDSFDKVTPFIPHDEIPQLIAAFNQYTHSEDPKARLLCHVEYLGHLLLENKDYGKDSGVIDKLDQILFDLMTMLRSESICNQSLKNISFLAHEILNDPIGLTAFDEEKRLRRYPVNNLEPTLRALCQYLTVLLTEDIQTSNDEQIEQNDDLTAHIVSSSGLDEFSDASTSSDIIPKTSSSHKRRRMR